MRERDGGGNIFSTFHILFLYFSLDRKHKQGSEITKLKKKRQISLYLSNETREYH